MCVRLLGIATSAFCSRHLFATFIYLLFISSPDIGGFFETGTLVKYNLPPAALAGASRDAKAPHQQPKAHGVNLTREDVAFSFSTSSAPAVLMYVSSKTEDYMAVVLRQNGTTHAHTRARTHYIVKFDCKNAQTLSVQHSLGSSVNVRNPPLSMKFNRAAHKVERCKF